MKRISLSIIFIVTAVLFSCSSNNFKFEQNKGSTSDGSSEKSQKISYYKKNTSIDLPQNNENSLEYIIPNSDKEKITSKVLDNLTKEEIEFARNEIYARHGYLFKSKKYKEYFNSRNWYKSNPDFDEKNFNDIEKNNLKVIDSYINLIEKSTIVLNNDYGKYDLNSDGVVEEIGVEFKDDGMTYELTINNVKETQTIEASFETMVLYDINSEDEFKEIAIVDEKLDTTYFQYYDGKNIIHMGMIPGTNRTITVNGEGRILTKKKGSILGLKNWSYLLRYKLTEKRALEKDSNPTYYDMNYEAVIKTNLKLFNSPNNKSDSFEIKEGDSVKLISSDDEKWCELETSDGKKGWFEVENSRIIYGSDVSDVFEGLDILDK